MTIPSVTARIFILILFIAGLSCSLNAQKIIGVGTRYVDSFREWEITTDDEDVEGELEIRWAFRNDWTEWDIRIGDITATIERKWKDDPNLWEIQCEGVIVNAKTTWPGEFNRWKLTDGTHQFNWGTKYFNLRDEWLAETKNDGYMQLYTYWDGDPREWVVVDELSSEVSTAMRLAMIFLAIHFSTPRI